MKNILMALMVVLTTMTLVLPDAEARRMGGSRSFGKQSQNVTRTAPTQSTQNTTTATKPAATPSSAAGAAKPASPWRGMLGGALLGLGLGALLSHLGMGAAMAEMISTLLMIGLLAFAAMFIFRMLRRKSAPGPQGAYAGGFNKSAQSAYAPAPEIGSRIGAQPAALQSVPLASGGADALAAPWDVPADFDAPAFLRNAKTYFIRLQAAWDKADINDIREFTTPEMYAELKLQIQERGANPNTTDVVSLDAELLGIETVSDEYLASVKFSGQISEATGAPAEPFAEVWNLSKPVSGSGGWALAGIQQLS